MTAANPEGYRRTMRAMAAKHRALAIRESLLAGADIEAAAVAAEAAVNELNDRLNELGQSVATSVVARALIANGLLQVASMWLTHFNGTPDAEDNRRALQSIVDELPPCLTGTSEIKKELVQ